MAIDPKNFKSAKQVLDFIGCDFDGCPCNAITALQMAMFEQSNESNEGTVGLSRLVTKELLPTLELPPNKLFLKLNACTMFGLPVKCERLLASALYINDEGPAPNISLRESRHAELGRHRQASNT